MTRLAAALGCLISVPLAAGTFTVTNTNDSGIGSLRQAILDANADAGIDVIAFDIPGAGVHTISPMSPLPPITNAAVLDGYTQPGASQNTQSTSDDAVLMIELDGESSGAGSIGLAVDGVNSVTIRGLVINRFGINVVLGAGDHLEGCFVGTDPTGTIARSRDLASGVSARLSTVGGALPSQRNVISGNNGDGIRTVSFGPAVIQGNFIGIDATGTLALPNQINVNVPYGSSVIGGPATPAGAPPGNVISGGASYGIRIGLWGMQATATIRGNLIGTDAGGAEAIPNASHGVLIYGEEYLSRPDSVTVGGPGAEDGNVIAYNAGDGIATAGLGVYSAVFRSNGIHSNTGLGIDRGDDGVTPNADGNPRNYPFLIAAVSSGGSTTIQGTLNSAPNVAGISIDLFSGAACDDSGNGEGATSIGSTTVNTDADGNASFGVVLPLSLEAGSVVTSTASTNRLVSTTSEFSACMAVTTDGDPGIQVLAISPRSGDAAGGTPLTVAGTGFAQSVNVTIGGVPAESVVVVDSNRIDATTPPLSPGTLNDVSVFDSVGSTSTLSAAWMADFLDVPQDNPFHAHVEKLFRNGVTAGCGFGNYCIANPVRRDQMSVFLLKAMHGSEYLPPNCAPPGFFLDVPCPGPFTDWVEQLHAEGITAGCGPDNYCPDGPVRRDQMAVFLLKAEHGAAFIPLICTPPGRFLDAPCPGPFTDWIEQIAAEGITVGCGADNYCPDSPVTRGQMAVFLVRTFHLQ